MVQEIFSSDHATSLCSDNAAVLSSHSYINA